MVISFKIPCIYKPLPPISEMWKFCEKFGVQRKAESQVSNYNHKNVYRHELKYIMPQTSKEDLIQRFKSILSIDPNCPESREGYLVRSLYFDDYYQSAYVDKLMGLDHRKKYRIRVYNGCMDTIKLECKHKVRDGIYKESAFLEKEQYHAILAGDIGTLAGELESLLQRFCLEMRCNRLAPRVIVDYDRIPLICPYGDVRITLDMHIRAGIQGYDISAAAIPAMEVLPGEMVLEVKYTHYLPSLIREVLAGIAECSTAVSKYVLCARAVDGLRL